MYIDALRYAAEAPGGGLMVVLSQEYVTKNGTDLNFNCLDEMAWAQKIGKDMSIDIRFLCIDTPGENFFRNCICDKVDHPSLNRKISEEDMFTV